MGKGDKYDAGDAPEDAFDREFEQDEEVPYPEDKPAESNQSPDTEASHVKHAVALLIKRLSRPGPAEVFPWPGGDVSRPGSATTAYGGALLPTSEQLKWPSIHRLLGPWFPGRLGVLVGSTGSGKTAFAVQVAEAVTRHGAPVLYASAELGRVELAARFIALRSRGNADEPAMRDGVPWTSILAMKTAEPELIEAGKLLVSECPNLYLWAPPSSQRTVEDLAAMTKAVSKAHGGRSPFVVVDYIQRWAPDVGDNGKREAVSGLSARLRELSRPDDDGEWPGAAILALSSTARSNYAHLRDVDALTLARDGGMKGKNWQAPVDLVGLGKESGELEYDAPLVMCLASDKGNENEPMGQRAALVVVPKNRHGHRGSTEWEFLAAVGRFVDKSAPTPTGKTVTRPGRR
ncbi:MAG: AAA family ATPase [Proteobacteria bacterium]|nr:AAA family ATPase [Pseudomonadota bacterium]